VLTQDKKLLLIGRCTALSGIPIRTIRYEGLGLLKSSGTEEASTDFQSTYPSFVHQAGSKPWLVLKLEVHEFTIKKRTDKELREAGR